MPSGFLEQNLISLVVIALLVITIYLLDRKNFVREGAFLLRRTKRGVEFINMQASKHGKFYNAFGMAGVVIALGVIGVFYVFKDVKKRIYSVVLFSLFFGALFLKYSTPLYTCTFVLGGTILSAVTFLFKNALTIFIPSLREQLVASLQFVLPLKVEGAPVFYVPLPYWLIAILVILVVHEFAHALVARARDVPVKSVGYGFLAIIPLGFAEPDEKVLNRKDKKTKLMVYGAGSFSNFIFGFIFLVLFQLAVVIAAQILVPAGVVYEGKVNGTYAYNVIPEKGVITSINGTRISSLYDLQLFLMNASVNESVNIIINGQEYNIKLSPNPQNSSLAFIGILNVRNKLEAKQQIRDVVGNNVPLLVLYLASLFKWLFILNVGIGVANLLPFRPLDGGFIVNEIITNSKFARKRKKFFKNLAICIEFFVFALFLINIFGPYVIK